MTTSPMALLAICCLPALVASAISIAAAMMSSNMSRYEEQHAARALGLAAMRKTDGA